MHGKLLVVAVVLAVVLSVGWALFGPSAAEAVAYPNKSDSPVNLATDVNYILIVVGMAGGFVALLVLTLIAASMTLKRESERANAINHVGITVTDVARSQEFYAKVLGFRVTGEGVSEKNKRRILFLGTRSNESQIMLRQLIEGEKPTLPHLKKADKAIPLLDHVCFSVPSLADLKAVWQHLKETAPDKIVECVTHGSSVSVYCYDPDDNLVEVSFKTGFRTLTPGQLEVDFSSPAEELLATSKFFANASRSQKRHGTAKASG